MSTRRTSGQTDAQSLWFEHPDTARETEVDAVSHDAQLAFTGINSNNINLTEGEDQARRQGGARRCTAPSTSFQISKTTMLIRNGSIKTTWRSRSTKKEAQLRLAESASSERLIRDRSTRKKHRFVLVRTLWQKRGSIVQCYGIACCLWICDTQSLHILCIKEHYVRILTMCLCTYTHNGRLHPLCSWSGYGLERGHTICNIPLLSWHSHLAWQLILPCRWDGILQMGNKYHY